MTEPLQPDAASDHPRHDPSLIAALAVREADLDARDGAAARDLVARCASCRDLLADLVAFQTALPMTSTPSRPRDFTLTDADARRLRGSGIRRLVGFFGSARDGFSKPLAVGLTTIGVVALVFTAAPNLSFGMASQAGPVLSTVGAAVGDGAGGAPAAAPSREIAGELYSAAPSAAASIAQAAPSAAPTVPEPAPGAAAASGSPSAEGGRTTTSEPYGTDGDGAGVFTGSNDTDNQSGDADTLEAIADAAATPIRDGGPSLGIVIAGIGLILGLGLFALRWTSRRLDGS